MIDADTRRRHTRGHAEPRKRKGKSMNTRALAMLLAGGFLAFAGTTIHTRHLFAERSSSPAPSTGQIIEFKLKGSERTVYITRQDQIQHWSILGLGIALFLLGAKGGALKRSNAHP